MLFKENFINGLKLQIPDKIKGFNLIYPREQNGYARFNDDRLEAVYLENLTDEYGNEILIKFNYRDFHYTPASYKFDSIYFLNDGCNEFRYDKDLKLIAKYLRDISILPNIDYETRLHILETLIEWKNISDKLDGEYISAYQIERNEKKVRVPYVVLNDKSFLENSFRYKVLNNIVEEFDASSMKCFQKCEIVNDKLIKKGSIYLGKKNNSDDR